jgi:hypothetical protein
MAQGLNATARRIVDDRSPEKVSARAMVLVQFGSRTQCTACDENDNNKNKNRSERGAPLAPQFFKWGEGHRASRAMAARRRGR